MKHKISKNIEGKMEVVKEGTKIGKEEGKKKEKED